MEPWHQTIYGTLTCISHDVANVQHIFKVSVDTHVCVYVCARACMFEVCGCVCMFMKWVWIYVHVCVCMHVCAYTDSMSHDSHVPPQIEVVISTSSQRVSVKPHIDQLLRAVLMQMRMNFTTPLAKANDRQSQDEVCV